VTGGTEWFSRHGVEAYERMTLIREFESRLGTYASEGLIKGSTHPSVGMEAVAVGVCRGLRRDDLIASTHRGHGHCLAKGLVPDRLLAEIFGRELGYCKGKGGSMHVASAADGVLGTNGIVGASIGIATGAALQASLEGADRVAVAFFGDGAINQGMFHEAMNLCAIWALPCIFVCENNHYAQSASIRDMVAIDDLTRRADAYGVPGQQVDGMDVVAVHDAAAGAIGRARAGSGPTLLVADTWRYLGHMVGDTEIYRTADDAEPWRARDPIARFGARLVAAGVAAELDLDQARERALAAVASAEQAARAAVPPPAPVAFADVHAEVAG
jgi:acetoin:2,6-dichlorophenolindophenol oxidoreductase subunit alpha